MYGRVGTAGIWIAIIFGASIAIIAIYGAVSAPVMTVTSVRSATIVVIAFNGGVVTNSAGARVNSASIVVVAVNGDVRAVTISALINGTSVTIITVYCIVVAITTVAIIIGARIVVLTIDGSVITIATRTLVGGASITVITVERIERAVTSIARVVCASIPIVAKKAFSRSVGLYNRRALIKVERELTVAVLPTLTSRRSKNSSRELAEATKTTITSVGTITNLEALRRITRNRNLSFVVGSNTGQRTRERGVKMPIVVVNYSGGKVGLIGKVKSGAVRADGRIALTSEFDVYREALVVVGRGNNVSRKSSRAVAIVRKSTCATENERFTQNEDGKTILGSSVEDISGGVIHRVLGSNDELADRKEGKGQNQNRTAHSSTYW